jgi:hypothetical protein
VQPPMGAHHTRRGREKKARKRFWEEERPPKGRLGQGLDNPCAIFGAWVRSRVKRATPNQWGAPQGGT